jgi:GAF domain-containing protein
MGERVGRGEANKSVEHLETEPQPGARANAGPQRLTDLDGLRAAHMRFSALLQVGMRLGQERDPAQLADKLAAASRAFLGARLAIVGMLDSADQLAHYAVCAADPEAEPAVPRLPARWGRIDEVLTRRRSIRLTLLQADPAASGLPADFPLPVSALIVPVASVGCVYGWLCLIDKAEAEGFTLDDESVASTLAAQAGRAYEMAQLYQQALARIAALEAQLARETGTGPA